MFPKKTGHWHMITVMRKGEPFASSVFQSPSKVLQKLLCLVFACLQLHERLAMASCNRCKAFATGKTSKHAIACNFTNNLLLRTMHRALALVSSLKSSFMSSESRRSSVFDFLKVASLPRWNRNKVSKTLEKVLTSGVGSNSLKTRYSAIYLRAP